MARVRKCDRCNKTYEPYEDDFNTLSTSTYNMDNEQVDFTTSYDLCPSCKEDFIRWYNKLGNINGNSIGNAVRKALEESLTNMNSGVGDC